MDKINWNELYSLCRSFREEGILPLTDRQFRWVGYKNLPNAFYHPSQRIYSTSLSSSLTLKDQLSDLDRNMKVSTSRDLKNYYSVVFALLKEYLNSPDIETLAQFEDFERFLKKEQVNYRD